MSAVLSDLLPREPDPRAGSALAVAARGLRAADVFGRFGVEEFLVRRRGGGTGARRPGAVSGQGGRTQSSRIIARR